MSSFVSSRELIDGGFPPALLSGEYVSMNRGLRVLGTVKVILPVGFGSEWIAAL